MVTPYNRSDVMYLLYLKQISKADISITLITVHTCTTESIYKYKPCSIIPTLAPLYLGISIIKNNTNTVLLKLVGQDWTKVKDNVRQKISPNSLSTYRQVIDRSHTLCHLKMKWTSDY